MAIKLSITTGTTGSGVTKWYALYVQRSTGKMADTTNSTWDTIVAGDLADYSSFLTEVSTSGVYEATVPAFVETASLIEPIDYVILATAAGTEAWTDGAIGKPRYQGTLGAENANLTAMVSVAQSATDLKDFADDGYDPSTNKVQGVVLVDLVTLTTTTTTATNVTTVNGLAANVITAAATAADYVTEVQNGLATAAALATAQADLDTITGSNGVTLATSQPNYAPATAASLASLVTTVGVAGAGLTEAGGTGDHLTAIPSVGAVLGGINTTGGTITTLDALDTAQDSQHSTTQGSLTTVLARLGSWTGTGVNTILGAFKALLSKAASTPSDIGGTFDAAADSTEAIRDRGDVAWITATGFSTFNPGSDTVTVGAFNTAAKAELQQEATDALNAYDPPTRAEATSDANSILTAVGDVPTVAEFEARTLVAANYFDPATDKVQLHATQPDYVPATSTALATAQLDLDILTGTDGATLATSQPNYAPSTALALTTLSNTVGIAGAGLTEAGGTGDHLSAVPYTGPAATAIADATLARAVQNVENTADKHSLGAMVILSTNASVSGTTVTAKKPSDDSTFFTYTVTVDAAADPITGVS